MLHWNKENQMNDISHTILCVDDEANILQSLKRLLRKENYRLLTAPGGREGMEVLEKNEVHLIISDQRMPGMSGTEFLEKAKDAYPDTIRIILSGYTDINAITESINKGHVYKFFLKPWNDQSLRLEIRQALEQYDLRQANKTLHQKVYQQNEELRRINENLEDLVAAKVKDIEIQNHALELSHEILADLPLAIIGVSAEGTIVMTNNMAQELTHDGKRITIGMVIQDFFSEAVETLIARAHETGTLQKLVPYRLSGVAYEISCSPLTGRWKGKGVVMTIAQVTPATGT